MNRLHDLAVKIRWASDKQAPADWSDIRRTTTVHSLYWVREGGGSFESKHGRYSVEPGRLFYLEPGLDMNMRAEHEAGMDMAMILFDCVQISGAAGCWNEPETVVRLELPHLFPLGGESSVMLDAGLSRVVELWSQGTPGREAEANAELLGLIARLHIYLAAEENGGPRAVFEQALSLIGRRFAEPLTAEKLAGELHVSVSYLRKIFVRYAGLTPKLFLSRLRLRHAERYLLYTDLTLRAIASSCGYGDEFHFSRTFKKATGVPPSEFRRRGREPMR
ncbi:AraC family transcriptional regulator [Saccharibacillus sp. CPCC 101409]|uniref:helix-turn-helix transcriptional regulator n=1 Tax=Saccharibacillus sp. CPCC 101409 TaxID=3058041 RepID=UPI00267320DA|nr:AraC family transcriptional regulator [Saccharibacillus sp. CPCC 101409]MDO3412537.1 AraC family transcriptional regulator [Saccharibacillus sp. CPCC 101409]